MRSRTFMSAVVVGAVALVGCGVTVTGPHHLGVSTAASSGLKHQLSPSIHSMPPGRGSHTPDIPKVPSQGRTPKLPSRDAPLSESTATTSGLSVVRARWSPGAAAVQLAFSHNGGTTWRTTRRPMAYSVVDVQVAIVDANVAWALLSRQPGAGSAPKVLLGTTNGGQTWQQLTTSSTSASRRSFPGFDMPTALLFLSPQLGWIVVSNPGQLGHPQAILFYRTTDGGRLWESKPLTPSGMASHGIYGNQIHNARVLDGSGRIIVTYVGRPHKRSVCHTVQNGMAWSCSISINGGSP